MSMRFASCHRKRSTKLLPRLSPEGSKFWCTFNPESPAHWMKREFIDHLDDLSTPESAIDLHYFTMDDNPTLSKPSSGAIGIIVYRALEAALHQRRMGGSHGAYLPHLA